MDVRLQSYTQLTNTHQRVSEGSQPKDTGLRK